MGVTDIVLTVFVSVGIGIVALAFAAVAHCAAVGIRLRRDRKVWPPVPPPNGEPYIWLHGGLHADEYIPVSEAPPGILEWAGYDPVTREKRGR